jgi:hypothetical protein
MLPRLFCKSCKKQISVVAYCSTIFKGYICQKCFDLYERVIYKRYVYIP